MPVVDIPVVREDLTDSNSLSTINCNLPDNKNNPVCNIVDDFLFIVLIFIIITIITYVIIIWAAVKAKNNNIKIFLIVSLFLPFLTPLSFILALLIIVGVIS